MIFIYIIKFLNGFFCYYNIDNNKKFNKQEFQYFLIKS